MAELIVQKYGGTSVASAELIKSVAQRIARQHDAGMEVVGVVSAMGDTTDELIALARQVAREPSDRELALLLSTGEMVTASLMTMALHDLGYDAVALTGFQAGIVTNQFHTKAQIQQIEPARIRDALDRRAIAIVAGYQGWTEEQDIAVLGRGGSDTTAVALAVALRASRCEILKDVDGVFTADPRAVPEARKLDYVSYEEMLELALAGSQVLHPRAAELGEAFRMPIVIRSSFTEAPGTMIVRGSDMALEHRRHVRAIAHDTDVARITIARVPDRPGIAFQIFSPLEAAAINVDVIVQNVSHQEVTDISFTVRRADLAGALRLLEPVAREIHATLSSDAQVAKVSIVGSGLATHPGYAARMFGALADDMINIISITTSEIRITCLIGEADVTRAVQTLHRVFELDLT